MHTYVYGSHLQKISVLYIKHTCSFLGEGGVGSKEMTHFRFFANIGNGGRAHDIIESKVQWKPFWLTTQQYPQNDWLGGSFPYTMTYAHGPPLRTAPYMLKIDEFYMILFAHPTPFFPTRCQGQPGHVLLALPNSFELSAPNELNLCFLPPHRNMFLTIW